MIPFPPPLPSSPRINHDVRPSIEQRACLPFFAAETAETRGLEPTDIVIVDFDRTLLASPALNRDLLTAQAYSVLESKLEWGHSWWQSPDVLQAAIDGNQWDPLALAAARATAAEPSALLVITTKRTTSSVPQIRECLAKQGIPRIDHISCLPADEMRGPVSQQVMLSKGFILEQLLHTYDSLERVYVIDGNHKNAPGYLRAAAKFSSEKWFNPEALCVVNKAMNTLQMPAAAQRALIQQMLRKSAVPVEAHILRGSAVRKLDYASRKRAIECLLQFVPSEPDLDQVFCVQIEPSSLARALPTSALPTGASPSETLLSSEHSVDLSEYADEHWRLTEFEISGKQCRFLMVCEADPSVTASVVAAKLKQAVNTRTVSVVDQEVLVTTYLYETRRLDLMVNTRIADRDS